jgi:pantoate--beta-alanine ligase
MPLETVRTVAELRARLAAWRARGETIGLVPTMGALHAGHLALVGRARADTARTVATLFVNPKQFGPAEDFARYPRTERADSDLLAAAGADLLFAPEPGEMYRPGFATRVVVEGPAAEGLEADYRPGFFEGVATVVAKLLLQAMPDRAYFGEKDYQQLLVIRRMVADLDLAVAIEGCATVRDADGLALSSRNAFLTAAERAIAPRLFKRLGEAAAAIRAGRAPQHACLAARDGLLGDGFAAVDYLEARDAASLAVPGPDAARPLRILAAARLGETRLIDNIPV